MSYHAIILTNCLPSTVRTCVVLASKTAPNEEPITSLETIGSSVYFKVSLAAFLTAALISATVTGLVNSTVKSTIDPVIVGTLKAVPSSLPFKCGKTFPIALAAPVEAGTTLKAAALPRLDKIPFLCGPSIKFWSPV